MLMYQFSFFQLHAPFDDFKHCAMSSFVSKNVIFVSLSEASDLPFDVSVFVTPLKDHGKILRIN